MRGAIFTHLVLGSVLGGMTFAATAERETTPQIEIRVHNYAKAPKRTLERAEKETTRILRQAGVEATWQRCAPYPDGVDKNPECGRKMNPTVLVLRILPRKMAARLSKDRDTFGFAASGSNGEFGYLADMFYDRIENLATRRGEECALLLGHFVAHEVGHLLLGAGSHSRSGIMHVPFDKMQLQRAVTGTLLFTPREAERMRTQVWTRTATMRP